MYAGPGTNLVCVRDVAANQYVYIYLFFGKSPWQLIGQEYTTKKCSIHDPEVVGLNPSQVELRGGKSVFKSDANKKKKNLCEAVKCLEYISDHIGQVG